MTILSNRYERRRFSVTCVVIGTWFSSIITLRYTIYLCTNIYALRYYTFSYAYARKFRHNWCPVTRLLRLTFYQNFSAATTHTYTHAHIPYAYTRWTRNVIKLYRTWISGARTFGGTFENFKADVCRRLFVRIAYAMATIYAQTTCLLFRSWGEKHRVGLTF